MKSWMMTNLGLMDIFKLLGKVSKRLQTVELFPLDIIEIQEGLMKDLKKMDELNPTDEVGDIFEKRFDEKLWANLDKDADEILSGEYRGQDTIIFGVQKRQIS